MTWQKGETLTESRTDVVLGTGRAQGFAVFVPVRWYSPYRFVAATRALVEMGGTIRIERCRCAHRSFVSVGDNVWAICSAAP